MNILFISYLSPLFEVIFNYDKLELLLNLIFFIKYILRLSIQSAVIINKIKCGFD